MTALMRIRVESKEPPYSIIDAMLANGAHMDIRDYDGRTFLHHVCMSPYSAIMVPELIKRGADPQSVDFVGNNILYYLAPQGRRGYLIEETSPLKLTFDAGADPKAKNHWGQLPLHIAAGSRRESSREAGMDFANFFLDGNRSPDIHAIDNSGHAGIHLAATISDGRLEAIFKPGADPYQLTFDGQTPLHIASRARESNSVGVLCDIYSSEAMDMICHVDRTGRTALHYACRSGRVESVKNLLEAGADPNVTDHKGLSPLCACAEFTEENNLWKLATTASYLSRFIDAAGMSLIDTQRPKRPKENEDSDSEDQPRAVSNDDSVGIRYITRVLLAHGAKVSPHSIDTLGSHSPKDALVYAIEKGL